MVLALFVFAGTTSASAHDSFGFSINLVTPSYYVAPPLYYSPPPAVYYSSPPVIYYEATPIYYGPNGYVRYYDPGLRYEHRYYRGRHGHFHDDDD